MVAQSKYPDQEPMESTWTPSHRECPDCGSLLWTGDWWDDYEKNGGACIGELWECGDCGFSDR